ncbi:uncharacterized [Tachysurus ichikawai]
MLVCSIPLPPCARSTQFPSSGRISLATLSLESRPDEQLWSQHLSASTALYLDLLVTDRHWKRSAVHHCLLSMDITVCWLRLPPSCVAFAAYARLWLPGLDMDQVLFNLNGQQLEQCCRR